MTAGQERVAGSQSKKRENVSGHPVDNSSTAGLGSKSKLHSLEGVSSGWRQGYTAVHKPGNERHCESTFILQCCYYELTFERRSN